MLKCKSCQAEIDGDSVFCKHCGKKQTTVHYNKAKRRANGTGSIRKRPNGYYQARITLGHEFRDGKARPITKTKDGFKTKAEASNYIPTLIANYHAEQEAKQLESQSKPMISELWEKYIQSDKYIELSKSQKSSYNTAYKKLSSIYNRHIDSLNLDELNAVITEQTKTYYPAKDMKDLLSNLYKFADNAQDNFKNLALKITLPTLEEKKVPSFSEEELSRIWKAYLSGKQFYGYILLMAYTGMMPGELALLRCNMIDYEKQEINGCCLKTTARRQSAIYFGKALIPILKDLCNSCSSQNDLILNMCEKKFRDTFESALIKCGCRVLKPYSCRHTTETLLVKKEVSDYIQKRIMRHKINDITQKYIDSQQIDIISAIDSITVQLGDTQTSH